jgi:UDP-N-acetylglucosamine enolpyruvyl transferase
MTSLLASFGVRSDPTDDGLVIAGRPEGPLSCADFDTEDDLFAAEGALLLALLGDGPSRIRRVDVLARRFPRIVGTLRALGADVRAEERTV